MIPTIFSSTTLMMTVFLALSDMPPPPPAAAKPAARPQKSLQKQLRDVEERMEALRGKITVLDHALADHTIYKDEPRKAADFARLRTKLATDLDTLETEWLALHDGTADA